MIQLESDDSQLNQYSINDLDNYLQTSDELKIENSQFQGQFFRNDSELSPDRQDISQNQSPCESFYYDLQLENLQNIQQIQIQGQPKINDFQSPHLEDIQNYLSLEQSEIKDFNSSNLDDIEPYQSLEQFQQNSQNQKSTKLIKGQKKIKIQIQSPVHQDIQVGYQLKNQQEIKQEEVRDNINQKSQSKKNNVKEKKQKKFIETKNFPNYYGRHIVKRIQNKLKNEKNNEMQEKLNQILDGKTCNNCEKLGKILDEEYFQNEVRDYLNSFDFFNDLLESNRQTEVAPLLKYANVLLEMSYRKKRCYIKHHV